jgi:adenylate cyclase
LSDDTVSSAGKTGTLSRLRQRIAGVPWRNAVSGRWWGRWFKKSIYQTGRLSAFLGLFLLLAIQYEDPTVLQMLRVRVFDYYQQLKPREVPPEQPVVIIDIDEKSLSELGQFPWPRTIFADLVTRAKDLGVAVIGFDVIWSEPDGKSITSLAQSVPETMIDSETRARLSELPSNDQILAQAIASAGNVVLGKSIITDTVQRSSKEPPRTSFAEVGDPRPFLPRSGSMLSPLPILDAAAAGRGAFSLTTYLDGIVRQVPMVLMADGHPHPALALEMLRLNLGGRTINLVADRTVGGISQISIRPPRSRDRYVVNTDINGQVWVHYRPHATFEGSYVSATDIINGRVPREKIEGKLALVGTSAIGLQDLRSSPLDQILPGVEVHANVLENIIFNTQLTRPASAKYYEWMATVIVGLFIIVITPAVSARIGLAAFLVPAGGMIWYSWTQFSQAHFLFDPSFPVLVGLLFYIFLTFAGYTREEAQKKQVRTAFGQYLSPALVQKLAEDPSKLTLGGENREMTFMFSDVRGFTAISELFDAQGLTKLINRLLTPLTNAILGTNGTIDKYMGDCVMAFWNAPLEVRDHGASACRAALKMIEAVKGVNEVLAKEAEQEGREHRPLAIGIGINSGIACVGNMGSEQRFDYSVLGDNVNLASRLEGQSKSYGVTIVVGENTANDPDVQKFPLLEMDLIQVKGKKQAVRIYTLAGDTTASAAPWFIELRRLHTEALAAYRAQKWDEAERLIAQCLAIAQGQTGLAAELTGFYDVLSERITDYRANPPASNWDGVYVATSK